MNYVILTVKVIKNSGQSFFKNGTSLTELVVQLPQISKNYPKLILNLSIWGKLSYDVAKYYKSNDNNNSRDYTVRQFTRKKKRTEKQQRAQTTQIN